MIEDYYKILKLTPKNGLYKISIRYLRRARKLLKSDLTANNEEFFQLNRAFEVLRIQEVRKYYDIIYNEYINNTLDTSNAAIIRYSEIIEHYKLLGNERAEKLISDPEYLQNTKINQSWFLLLLNFIFYLRANSGSYKVIPLLGITFIILSINLIFTGNGFHDPYRLAPGIVLGVFGLLIVFFNFRQFIIDRMDK